LGILFWQLSFDFEDFDMYKINIISLYKAIKVFNYLLVGSLGNISKKIGILQLSFATNF